jgi:dihydroflavonol-4-reductase
MPVLVTGGTGFVGGTIVRELLRRGQTVRVLARRTSNIEALEKLGVQIAYGDILDRPSIEKALEGCDTLYHAAAMYEFWVRDEQALIRTEIEGTRNAMEAAIRRDLKKVVYTSTAFTVGEPKGTIGTESTSHRGYFLSRYERAKYEAERGVKSALARGLPVVIVKPAAVIGRGDLKPTGLGTVAVLNGGFPAIFKGVLSFVDAGDVARAHVFAAEKPAGEEYILSERTAETGEWLGTACDLAGAPRPPTIPAIMAQAFLGAEEAIANWRKRRPLLPRETIAHLLHGLQVDGSKAARELGLTYTPMKESLREAIAWYWEQGLLKKKPACVE